MESAGEQFVDRFLQVDGINTHVIAAGESGSSVLLLHGGGTDSAALSWRLAIPVLAASHHVFAPDWPGYGQSDRPHLEYTQEFYTQFLAHLIDALALDKPALVGLSLGGGAVLGYALREPKRVSQLVLVDSYGFMGKIPFGFLSTLFVRLPLVNELSWWSLKSSRSLSAWLLGSIFGDPKRVTPDLVGEMFELLRKPDAGRAFTSFQRSEATWSGLRTNLLERLGELSVPTLLIHGASDRLVPLELARQAQQRIAGAKLVTLPGCGHWPNRECPQEFNQVLAEFLD